MDDHGGTSNSTAMEQCWQKISNCELPSFCASQLSTALLLLVTILMLSAKMFQYSPTNQPLDKVLSLQYGAVMIAITFCYLLGVWKIERDDFDQLRNCKKHWVTIEWWLRVFILVFVGIASLFFSGIYSLLHFPPVTAGILFLSICCFLFLLWDAIVAMGDKIDYAWFYFPLDFFGAFTVVFCLYSSFTNSLIARSISAVFAISYAVLTMVFFKNEFMIMISSIVSKDKRR